MEYYLRPVKAGDAEALAAIRRMPGVFENITGLASERDENMARRLAELGANDHELVAVLMDENGAETVIGACGLSVEANPRRRHRASIGIMVHTEHQNRGVGSRLLDAILDVADNWLMLVRVELVVFVDNESAIGLYEKKGFVKEGVRRCSMIRDGKYVDTLIMGRIRNLPAAREGI